MKVIYPYDTTPFIRVAIEEVVKTLFEAIFLVFLVMYLFMGTLTWHIEDMIRSFVTNSRGDAPKKSEPSPSIEGTSFENKKNSLLVICSNFFLPKFTDL